MKKITFIFILAVLLIACKKKSAVTIQAQNLTNLSDGSHYAGAHYMVIERRSGLSVDNIKSKVLVDDYLDANGYASFDIKMNNNRSYVLGIEKPDNICYTEVTIEYFLDHDKNNVVNFNYAPCGYVNLQRTNVNCEGATDKFRYKYYYTDNLDIYIYTGFVYGSDHLWSDNSYLEGCNDYLGDFSEKRPAGHYTIEWMVERPSGTTYGSDTFVVTEGDTTTYILEY